MDKYLSNSLERLYKDGRLDKQLILWGIGGRTNEIIQWLKDKNLGIFAIVDNFKYTFFKEYENIPVYQPQMLKSMEKDFTVLLATNHNHAIRKQLLAYGIHDIYNLLNLDETLSAKSCEIPYHFTNRSKGKKVLCYILTGYETLLWENVLGRIAANQNEEIDYCLISSGIYSEELEQYAQRQGWSYLATNKNQVCYIQNLVIELHPNAEYIFKMDEDIFIGNGFFELMLEAYRELEKHGEYRIGFLVPVIPLNCSGYVSFLDAIGQLPEYEKLFGRAYRSRFSAVFSREDVAEFLWNLVGNIDEMARRFSKRDGYKICDCYYNIGCILYSRERWLMMGKWPVNENESGMGIDERYILQDNFDKDMVIYEAQNVFAGHLAFGHQKKLMYEYFQEKKEVFCIQES